MPDPHDLPASKPSSPIDEAYVVLRLAADLRGDPRGCLLSLATALEILAKTIPPKPDDDAHLEWLR